ncbi:uncharacterized protein LOC119665638 [Teleopsis dalmanni]|uniref:uncharacterized protein LOC119665638 n=1 Tax=Teleopsis dalmanni TaxID=139649 RepID=UPI0018CFE8DE|nr:uncharacterized protein LOC119665638 [Teleopsis dalmanni]
MFITEVTTYDDLKRESHSAAEDVYLPGNLPRVTGMHGPIKTQNRHRCIVRTTKVTVFAYCVEFEVLRASKACHKLPPYNLMLEGDRISVRCNLETVKYDTRINIMPLSTSQKYTLTADEINLSNSSKWRTYMRNIFATAYKEGVDEANLINDEEGGENKSYDKVTKSIKAPNTTKVTTTTTPASKLIHRCRGEGLPGRITRWSALPTPSCRGKWLRLTVGVPRKCTHSEFKFV